MPMSFRCIFAKDTRLGCKLTENWKYLTLTLKLQILPIMNFSDLYYAKLAKAKLVDRKPLDTSNRTCERRAPINELLLRFHNDLFYTLHCIPSVKLC